MKIDVMQTNALCAPLNKPNAPAKMCYLLLTIIRTISKIFMMVPPVAKTEEMANHGGSGGRHGQNRALKTKNNALGGKRLMYRILAAVGAPRDVLRAAPIVSSTEFLCAKEFRIGRDFGPF